MLELPVLNVAILNINLLGRHVCGDGTLRHDKDRRLPLASVPASERMPFFTVRRLRGEEALVEFHLVRQPAETVPLPRHVTQLMHHFPDRLISLPSKLALYLQSGNGPLGACNQEHCHEPVETGSLLPCITVPERRVVS